MELVPGGTDEWYWGTDYIHGDLYEAEELFREGHTVQSNRLYLIHYPDGIVYEPIPPVAGQYLGNPVYDEGTVVLLAVNFTQRVICISRFLHEQNKTEEIAYLPLSIVDDCYNLILHTTPLTLTQQQADNTFSIIWPEHVRFKIGNNEALNFRDGNKLYFSAWYDEDELDYYEETHVRAIKDGAILEKFSGYISIMPNGEKWLIK